MSCGKLLNLGRTCGIRLLGPRRALLDRYSSDCLKRVWKAERFSSWLTSLLHRFPNQSSFDRKIQLAELEYLSSSAAAEMSFAENYIGLPL